MTTSLTPAARLRSADRHPRPPEGLMLPSLLASRAVTSPHKVFVREVGGESLTYRELFDRSRALAENLHLLGVRPGDRVTTLLPNSVDSVVVLCAAALAGAIHVPLNNAYMGTLLQHALNVSEPRVMFVDVSLSDRVDNEVTLPEGCRVIWRKGFPDANTPDLAQLSKPGTIPDGPASLHQSDWSEICTLLFTSGTTGASKAVAIPWLHLYLSSVRIWQAQELDDRLVLYSPWPVNHISGTGGIYMSMIVGGSIVLRDKWSTSGFVEDVTEHGCTATTLMAEAVGYLRHMPGLSNLPLTHVFVAPVTDYVESLMEEIGAKFATNYNSTEICSPIGTLGWRPVPPGSCGYLREGVQARIVDENGNDVPDGMPGEALFRTDDAAAMNLGYWGMEEATARAWKGGWFHTGDLMRREADGLYYFLGRLKDRLRSRGENVSPDELEAILLRHPDVKQCAAVGRPNEIGEDDIVLYIVSDTLSEQEVLNYAEGNVPRFMRPREVRLAESLPETPTGKVRRAELREMLLGESREDQT